MRILIIAFFWCSMVYATNVIESPELLYQLPVAESSPLTQKVTINWKYSSFNDFLTYLQKTYAIKYKVMSSAQPVSTPVLIYVDNGSLEELINQAANKFGYSWVYKDNIVIVKALNPVITNTVATKSISTVSAWTLMPSDKTLRNALLRWCKSASWQLVWNVRADYPITTSWSISGSFESAVNEVLKASQDTDMPLQAIMHDSNHVLEITSPANNR